MRRLTILGSTGSIGHSTLAVVRRHPEQFQIIALVAGRNVNKMVEQCLEFKPRYAALAELSAANMLTEQLKQHGSRTEVVIGETAAAQLAALPEVNDVMAAIVGAAGLSPTLAAIQASKRVLLANKESLVMCGRLFMDAVRQHRAQLLPIDSEHNAIFQSLPHEIQQQLGIANLADFGISNIILTGSGGPFRERPLTEFATITVEQACQHPNWSMGKKISVDSATMMNKGLEYIEARYLFNASAKQVEVIIHPQSVIHSMVRYIDGSLIAQLGAPDMRIPIAHALAYPARTTSGAAPLDFSQLTALTFQQPDYQRYPCLKLAIEASQSGQAATTALNAANEIAVTAFLDKKIAFNEIAQISDYTLQHFHFSEPTSLAEVVILDQQIRIFAQQYIQSVMS